MKENRHSEEVQNTQCLCFFPSILTFLLNFDSVWFKATLTKSIWQCSLKMEILAVMETCFWGTLGDSKLKYSMILIWLLCMWIQLKNILPSNDLIDIEKDHIEA